MKEKEGWLYVSVYSTEEELAEAIETHLDGEDVGTTTFIVSFPGGSENGIDYDPLGVDAVWLGGGELCFRMSSEMQDGEWRIGSCEHAAAEAWGLAQTEPEEDIDEE